MTVVENDLRRSPLRLLIASSDRTVSAADVRRLMARFGYERAWSDTAVEQLVRAAAAAERLLAQQPEEAARLFEDPASAVEAMRRSGLLTEPVDDLLAALQSLSSQSDAMSGARGRRVRTALRSADVRFGDKPALQFTAQYGTQGAAERTPASGTCKPDKRKR
jgi:hypothetical protein